MLDDERLTNSKLTAQSVMEIATKNDIPLTPSVYEVLVNHVQESNPDIEGLVSNILAEGGEDIEQKLDEVHHEFFGPAALQRGLQRIRDDLENQIDNVADRLKFGLRGNLELSSVLRESMRDAAGSKTKEELATVCKNVVVSSRDHLSTTQDMAEQLKRARQELSVMQRELSSLRESAFKDHLTGLMNRRFLEEKLDKMIEYSEPFCFALIDLDNFKDVNDTWGHSVGDNILRGLGKLLIDNTKGRDFAARIGGEEFALVLPKTPFAGAVGLCDGMRVAFSQILWRSQQTDGEIGKLTFSCGVTEWSEGETVSQIFERTDRLLYNSKKAGRNRLTADGG